MASDENRKKDHAQRDIISRIPNWGWLLISFLAAMLLWKWLSVNPTTARSFPFAPEVLASLGTMIERGVLWQDFSSSMISVVMGFVLGFVTSVPVAFLMAWYRPVRYIVEPWIQFIRNIPPLAYVPLIVIAAESTGAVAGLGMRIRSLNNSFESAPMLLYIIIIGILGITIEKLIKHLERRLTSWQEKREI